MVSCSWLLLALSAAHVCLAVWPVGDTISLLQHMSKPASSMQIFNATDKVEIPVTKLKETHVRWVPATIVKQRFQGFYDVSVQLGPEGRYKTEIQGMPADLPRRPPKATSWAAGRDYYASNPKDAKEVIQTLELESQKKLVASLYAKGLSQKQVQDKMASITKAKKAKEERLAREKGCPAGYQAVDGDGKGADQFGRNFTNIQDTIEMCKEDCEKRNGCLSFEWSPGTAVCNLNKASEPFHRPHFMDFIYCQRLATMNIKQV